MMGKRSKKSGRNINGILLLDKPSGMTSNGALQHVKRIFNANKAGHTGSLDAPATGLLPICLGEATKISAFLLNSDKTYQARCKLGITTATGDACGDLLESREVPEFSSSEFEKYLQEFVGEIEQTPPMFSALKHNGKRLYELAYKGVEVERKSRKVTINSLALVNLIKDEFEIEVSCSKGTYIRTLVEDIGYKLGCGAHILTLRRLQAGPFQQSQMVTPIELQSTAEHGFEQLDKLLLPIDVALKDMPEVHLSDDVVSCLCQGQTVAAKDLPGSGRIRIYNTRDQFIGLGEVTGDGQISPKRLINNINNQL